MSLALCYFTGIRAVLGEGVGNGPAGQFGIGFSRPDRNFQVSPGIIGFGREVPDFYYTLG
jgi:hypothetical protein